MCNPWIQPAQQLARTAAWIRQLKSRGAVPVRLQGEDDVPMEAGPLIVGIFSSDQVLASIHGRFIVAFVRQELEKAGLEELAFGFSEDFGSWAMLISASDEHQTQVGRYLHRELLLLDLERILCNACQADCESGGEAPIAEWSA